MSVEEIVKEINQLKIEKDAVILAHNYQLPEIQDIADYHGDSLELARKASEVTNSRIVFCGVYFMAETAAILNPDRKVLLPDLNAGCPLAEFATARQVQEWRKVYPDYAFVAYINTNADVKAEVDICCTSSNAIKVVNSIEAQKIVFLPDCHLGEYVRRHTDKEIVLWNGYCIVHHKADLDAIKKTKAQHPEALIMAHPECPLEIQDFADAVCSTGQMFDVVRKHPQKQEFIVVTEWGMVYALQKEFPDRIFYEPFKRMNCVNMKKITLLKVRDALKKDQFQITVKPEIARRARKSIDKMLSI